ncbi:unnamed protein product [Paramecium sonneborni]|uniref:Uncharacterized protein n=1 Tax=Paramecium sonneborni TaxID=65129 RepID=A0A8S1L3F6_9CILI|nr:unnamed protein product [Paramecium sonneborni]
MTILIKDQKYLKDHLILFENREESELNLFQLKVSEQVVKF